MRARTISVSTAVASGRVSADAFSELRRSLYAVQAWAIDAFGEEGLREALGRIDVLGYRPPLPDTDSRRSENNQPIRRRR